MVHLLNTCTSEDDTQKGKHLTKSKKPAKDIGDPGGLNQKTAHFSTDKGVVDVLEEQNPMLSDSALFPTLFIIITDFPSDLLSLSLFQNLLEDEGLGIGSIINIVAVPTVSEEYLSQLPLSYSPFLFPKMFYQTDTQTLKKKDKKGVEKDARNDKSNAGKGGKGNETEYTLSDEARFVLSYPFDNNLSLGHELISKIASTTPPSPLISLGQQLRQGLPQFTSPLFSISFLNSVIIGDIMSGTPIVGTELKIPQADEPSILQQADEQKGVHSEPLQTNPPDLTTQRSPAPTKSLPGKGKETSTSKEQTQNEIQRIDALQAIVQTAPSLPAISDPTVNSSALVSPQSILFRQKSSMELFRDLCSFLSSAINAQLTTEQFIVDQRNEMDTLRTQEQIAQDDRKNLVQKAVVMELRQSGIVSTEQFETLEENEIESLLIKQAETDFRVRNSSLPLNFYLNATTGKQIMSIDELQPLPLVDSDHVEPEELGKKITQKQNVSGAKTQKKANPKAESVPKKDKPTADKVKTKDQLDVPDNTEGSDIDPEYLNDVQASVFREILRLSRSDESLESQFDGTISADLRTYRQSIQTTERTLAGSSHAPDETSADLPVRAQAAAASDWFIQRKKEEHVRKSNPFDNEYTVGRLSKTTHPHVDEGFVLETILSSISTPPDAVSNHPTESDQRFKQSALMTMDKTLRGRPSHKARPSPNVNLTISTDEPPLHAHSNPVPFRTTLLKALDPLLSSAAQAPKEPAKKPKFLSRNNRSMSMMINPRQAQQFHKELDFIEETKISSAAKFFVDHPPHFFLPKQTEILPHFSSSFRMTPSLFHAVSNDNMLRRIPPTHSTLVHLHRNSIAAHLNYPHPPKPIEAASFSAAFSNPRAFPSLVVAGKFTQPKSQAIIPSSASIVLNSRRGYYLRSANKAVFFKQTQMDQRLVPQSSLCSLPSSEEVQLNNSAFTTSTTSLFPSISNLTRSIDSSYSLFQNSFHSAKIKKEDDIRKKPESAIEALNTLPSYLSTINEEAQRAKQEQSTHTDRKRKRKDSLKTIVKQAQTHLAHINDALIIHGPGMIFNLLVDASTPLLSPFTFHEYSAAMYKLLRAQIENKDKKIQLVTPLQAQLNTLTLSNGVTFHLPSGVTPRTLSPSTFLGILQLPALSIKAPSPLQLLSAQSMTILSLKSAILNFAESIRLASMDAKAIINAQQELYPSSTQPPDMITLADLDGDFAEGRDFFGKISELDMNNVLRDHDLLHNIHELNHGAANGGGGVSFGTLLQGEDDSQDRLHLGVLDDMLLHILLCGSFSEMLSRDADSSLHSFTSSSKSTLSGSTFIPPQFFSTFYPPQLTQPTITFTPISPESAPSSDQKANPPETQPFSFANPHVQLTLPSLNEQINRSSLGSFVFVSERDQSDKDAAFNMTPPLSAVSRHSTNKSQSTTSTPTNPDSPSSAREHEGSSSLKFKPFGMGQRWDGKDNQVSLHKTESPRQRGGNTSPRKKFSLPYAITPLKDSGQEPFSHLRAIYAPPIVDSSDYAVTEDYSKEAMSAVLSQLLIHDFPVRTSYFAPEDSLLLSIGSVQEKEGSGGIDRTYWVQKASPSSSQMKKQMKDRFSQYLSSLTTANLNHAPFALSPHIHEHGVPLNEQFATYANPREQVMIKNTIERTGSSLETSVTAFHRRGHVFSMRRLAKLQVGCEPPKDISLSKETLQMFLNNRDSSISESLTPNALSFALALKEIRETVPLSSVNAAYHVIVDMLRKAEASLSAQLAPQSTANPQQDDLRSSILRVSTDSVFGSHRTFLTQVLRQSTNQSLRNSFIAMSLPGTLSPSPLENHSPLSILLSPLLTSLMTFFKTTSPTARLISTISTQFKNLSAQLSISQVNNFDLQTALTNVKQAITSQLQPNRSEDILKTQFASQQLQPSSLAKLILTADVAYLHNRIVRNPLRSLFMALFRTVLLPPSSLNKKSTPDITTSSTLSSTQLQPALEQLSEPVPPSTAPVQFNYVSPPSFNTVFSDKTSVSMKAQVSQATPITFDVTYSTLDGTVVSIDNTTGSVRITHAPIAGEGNFIFDRGNGSLLMPDYTSIPTQKLLDHRKRGCQLLVDAAKRYSIEMGKQSILKYRRGEIVCGMQKIQEEEKEDPKNKNRGKSSEKVERPKAKAAQQEIPENPFAETSEDDIEVFRRSFTAHLTTVLRKIDPISFPSTKPHAPPESSFSGASSRPSKTRLSRGYNWSVPPELKPFCQEILPELTTSQPIYECERIVRGMGTSIVRMSSGETAVLLGNGDISVCDGNEWMSVNEKGQRTIRPLFSIPLLSELDLEPSDQSEVGPDQALLQKAFRGSSFPLFIPIDEVPIDPQNELEENDETPNENSEDDRPEQLKSDPDSTAEVNSLSTDQINPRKMTKQIMEQLPAVFPLPASSHANPSVLPPIQAVKAINSNETASVRTRADKVTIVQYNTGERLVHHADGTRVFHSFAFGDSPKLTEQYERETESQAPVKAVLCVEHPNSPRVLISIVQKTIGSYLQQRNQTDLAMSLTSSSESQNIAQNWVRENVTVCLSDGTNIEWSMGEKKVVLSKPDNTHIHFSANGAVSVFVDHPMKKSPPKFGPASKLPLLFFNTVDGTMSVRPSKKSTPVVSQTGKEATPQIQTGAIEQPSIYPVTPTGGQNTPSGPYTSIPGSSPLASKLADDSVQPQRKPVSARKIFFISLEGIATWIIARTMKAAVPHKYVSGEFHPTLFGQIGISDDLNHETIPSTQATKASKLVDSILAMPGGEDFDSVDYLEKRLKEMHQLRDKIASDEADEVKRQKRLQAQQARSPQGSPLQTPLDSRVVTQSMPTPGTNDEVNQPDTLLSATSNVKSFDQEVHLPTRRWIARLSAIHAHQIQLAQDTLLTTSGSTATPSLSSQSSTPFVLPRMFVIRHNGSGFELMRRKAVSRLYPRPNDSQSQSLPLFTASTAILTPTNTTLRSKSIRHLRLLSQLSNSAATNSDTPFGSPSLSPTQSLASSSSTHALTPLAAQQQLSKQPQSSMDPLLSYVSPYFDVDHIFYDILSSAFSDQKKAHSFQKHWISSPHLESPNTITLQTSLRRSSIMQPALDDGVLENSFRRRQSVQHSLNSNEDGFDAPKPVVHSDNFDISDISSLIQRSQEPLPALFGHGEAGLQLSLQQFSSLIPTDIPQAISGQSLVEIQETPLTPQKESSRLKPQTPDPSSSNKPIFSSFSDRVVLFQPNSIFPPGTLISPARTSILHIQQADNKRLPFLHLLESSSYKKKVGLSSVTSKKRVVDCPSKSTLDPAVLHSPIVKSMRMKQNIPNASFKRPKKQVPKPPPPPKDESEETKHLGPLDIPDFPPPKPQFSLDSFVIADRPQTEGGVTICIPLAKVLDQHTSPTETTSNSGPNVQIPSASTVMHLSYHPCYRTTETSQCTCNVLPKKDIPENIPSANLCSMTTDPNPLWTPYLPELLRFEPLSIRQNFLPPYVKDLNLSPSELDKILNGESKIPLPRNYDTQNDPNRPPFVHFTQLIERPSPPPLLILILYEYCSLINFITTLRSQKTLNRMNSVLSAYIDKMWSAFSDSVKWTSESVLHIRLKNAMMEQVQRLLGLLTQSETPKKAESTTAPKEEEVHVPPVAQLSTSRSGNLRPVTKSAQGSALSVISQTLPSLSAPNLKMDELYPSALNVLFDNNTHLKSIRDSVLAEEFIINQLLSNGWRKHGGRDSFTVPFTPNKSSKQFDKSVVSSFSGYLEVLSTLETLYPISTNAPRAPMNLSILYSTIPQPPLKRGNTRSDSQLQSSSSDSAKSKMLADKLFIRNVHMCRHERERIMVAQESSKTSGSPLLILNEARLEMAVSAAAKTAETSSDGYGTFRILIQSKIDKSRNDEPQGHDLAGVNSSNRLKAPAHRDGLKLNSSKITSFSFSSPSSWTKAKQHRHQFSSVKPSPSLERVSETVTSNDSEDAFTPEDDVISSPISLPPFQNDILIEKEKQLERPRSGKILSYFDSMEAKTFFVQSQSSAQSTNTKPATASSVVSQGRLETARRSFPPPDTSIPELDLQMSGRRRRQSLSPPVSALQESRRDMASPRFSKRDPNYFLSSQQLYTQTPFGLIPVKRSLSLPRRMSAERSWGPTRPVPKRARVPLKTNRV
ncbi:hypothetical protein BLNAU_224 [Blattamonas nauphoetae]|uniref:Uncharacterized protein n=1 Tax=Blattamonas nauphoetae TaxID=2049346 RepID=A0ABQ9YMC8_9EUKA|nr:hypothetical protein BLNAU_224 [Blattamonas nauphoetae]